jgi:predicted kinase
MKPFMILINGPAGAGKSTTAQNIWKKIPRTAIISLDEIKWLISDYKSNSFDLTLASRVGLAMAEQYLKNKINVIIEKAFCDYEYVEPFVKLAKKHKSKHLLYNLEAPLEIIKKRTKQRPITNLKHNKPPLKQSKVLRLYNYYVKGKFKVKRTFDTSKLSQRKIINQIMKDIKTS